MQGNVAADAAPPATPPCRRGRAGNSRPAPPTCTTRPTRPSAASSFPSCPTAVPYHWWPTCPPPPVAADRCEPLRPDLCRRAEEHRPVRPVCGDRARGAARPRASRHALRCWNYQGDGGRGFDAQHAADLRLVHGRPGLKWLRRQGGLAAMAARNAPRRDCCIPPSKSSFYRNPVDPACRSWMNVPFMLPNRARPEFISEAVQRDDQSRGASLGRRHARQSLQRDAD